MAFAGTLVTNVVYTQPSANPLPNTSTTAQLSQNVSVASGTAPGGQAASDFHTIEQDVYPTETTTLTTDAFYALAGSNVVEYGYKSADTLGNAISYSYATPHVIAEVPFTNGASWTNSPAETITENDADGTTSARTYAPDGSYTDNESFFHLQGVTANIVENADLSGSYSSSTFRALENEIQINAPAAGNITIAGLFPAPPSPSPNPSGSPSPSPNPTIPPRIVTLADWYPSTALYSEADTDGGSTTFPSGCNVPPAIGTQGEKLAQTIQRLDIVLGYSETQTTSAYVIPGFGPACIQMSDVTNAYYDYQGNVQSGQPGVTIGPFAFYSKPYQTTTIAETLGLQQATIKSAARRAAGTVRYTPVSPTVFEAGRASFLATVSHNRLERMKMMQRTLRKYLQRAGAVR